MKLGRIRVLGVFAAAWAAIAFLGVGFRVLADCSAFDLPFTDLGSTSFCAQIAEAYFSGLSNGTTSTSYSPTANVTREQMAAFVTRTLDASLSRGNRRAALGQWWNSTPHYDQGLGLVPVGNAPFSIRNDGTDLWVANQSAGTVSQVRASNGTVLGTWTGADSATDILVAMNRIFITGQTTPGSLYMIDPSQTVGAVTTVIDGGLGLGTTGITFDGNKIFVANGNGAVSIITPGTWSVTSATTGVGNPNGALFDGSNVWITDVGGSKLKKLDSNGAVLQSVSVGSFPQFPVFDGHNIWVPNKSDNSLTVVRASDGTVLKTFSAGNGDQNGLNNPITAAFDGQRILVTNASGGVSLFHATDLSIIGSFTTPPMVMPFGACSDGATGFWIADFGFHTIGRY